MAQANPDENSLNPSEINLIAETIRKAAYQRQGNSIALLELLRMMEGVHREISDGLFQSALPANRQALHSFLRDIETQGGWPYIYSRRLKAVLSELTAALLRDTEQRNPNQNETPPQ